MREWWILIIYIQLYLGDWLETIKRTNSWSLFVFDSVYSNLFLKINLISHNFNNNNNHNHNHFISNSNNRVKYHIIWCNSPWNIRIAREVDNLPISTKLMPNFRIGGSMNYRITLCFMRTSSDYSQKIYLYY